MRLMDKQFDIAENIDDGIVLISDATGKGKSYRSAEWIKTMISKGYKAVVIGNDKSCCRNLMKRYDGSPFNIIMLESKEENAKKAPVVDYSKITDKKLKEYLDNFYNEQNKFKEIEKIKGISNEIYKDSVSKQSSVLLEAKNQVYASFRMLCKNKKITKEEKDKIKKIIEPLFPENINDYSVIFMTADKFAFGKLDTLDKENHLISHNSLKGKCCFLMDETDACYIRHCRVKAQNALNIDDALFIIQTFYNNNITKEARQHRKKFDSEFEKEYDEDTDKIISVIKEINPDYHVLENFHFPDEDNTLKMFSSKRGNFLTGKSSEGYIFTKKNGTNILSKAKKNDGKRVDITKMEGNVAKVMFSIFNQFHKQKNKISEIEKDWTEEELYSHAISQVLNIGDGNFKNKLIQSAIDRQANFRAADKESNIKSVCTYGFRMFNFSNDNGYNHTHMEVTDFSLTPENEILAYAKKGPFVMMSATQQVQSINDYHMAYIEENLGDKFYKVSKEDFQEANKLHYKEYKDDGSIFSETVKYDSVEQILSALNKKFNNVLDDENFRILLKRHYEDIKRINENDNDYYARRYLKTVYAFLFFALSKDAKAGIIMKNASGKELEEYFSQILEWLKQAGVETGFCSEPIIYISSDDLKNNIIKTVHTRSKEGKVLIISSRNTIGQSVNLHESEIQPEGKDFNFIYIESPTYVNNCMLTNATKDERVKEYYERQKMAEIENVSPQVLLGETNFGRYSSYLKKKAKIVIQNVGRICRSQNKEEKTFILFDEELTGPLNLIKNSEVELNDALIAMLNALDQEEPEEITEEAYKNNEFCDMYKSLLNKAKVVCEGFANPARNKLEHIRDFIFKHGVYVPSDEYEDSDIFNQCYVKMTKSENYYIDDTDNYCEDISYFMPFGKSGYKCLEYGEFASKYGYSIPKERKCYVALPKVFNVLQGEVGERMFEEQFNRFCSKFYVKALSDEEFEKCGDFKIYNKYDGNPTNVYIDVKNFSSYSEKDITRLAAKKLENIESHNPNGKVIILNYSTPRRFQISKTEKALVISDFMVKGVINLKALKAIENFVD